MSMSVDVFVVGEDGGRVVLEPPSPGADLAGFEVFRTTVSGSDAVRGLCARLFPELSSGDLAVTPEEVPAFLQECALLQAPLPAVVPTADPDHTHEWYLETVAERLANIDAAAHRALELGGGVLIW